MKTFVFVLNICLLGYISFAQTTIQTGQWTNNATWSGGAYPGTLTINGGDDDLDLNNQTISVDHYVIVGSSNDRIDMNFANSNSSGSLTIEDNDTLIVYGDWDFANKSMDLNIGSNSVVIILGDATFANKVDVATSGTLVVSGNFNKAGTQGSYSGGGAVYAGSYSGNADSFIPGDVGTGGDQQQTIENLSDDGFPEIETFVSEGGSSPLPVELVYFNVIEQGNIIIKWATATEINNDYFLIERSEDGINFYEIGKVAGNGNTNMVIEYEFTDRSPVASVEYYRLKQVDYNGQYEYFDIKRVATRIVPETKMTAFPTVVKSGKLTVKMNQPVNIHDIRLVHLSGGSVRSLLNATSKSSNSKYIIDTSSLSKGFYLLKVSTEGGDHFSTRIIIE